MEGQVGPGGDVTWFGFPAFRPSPLVLGSGIRCTKHCKSQCRWLALGPAMVCRLVASAHGPLPLRSAGCICSCAGPFPGSQAWGSASVNWGKAFPFSCLIQKKKRNHNTIATCSALLTLPAQSTSTLPVTTCWHEVLKQLRKRFGNIQRAFSNWRGCAGFSLLGSALSLKPGLHSVGCHAVGKL